MAAKTSGSQPLNGCGGMKTVGAFDHEATAAMAEAYDTACQSMDDWGQPDIIKEIIAKRIIEVAGKGERDPGQLCERALNSLGFSESPSLQPGQRRG
jgi:hypothetical protein